MFHSATDSRIREVNSTYTMEHNCVMRYHNNSSSARTNDSTDYSISIEKVV